MEALNLNIKDGVGVNDQTGLGLNIGSQALLVGTLGGTHGLQELGVVLELLELLQLKGVLEPAVANGLGHELGIGGIGLGKEATVRDAVGLVVELLGRQGIEVLEHDVLDDVGVNLGHAVDAVAADHRQVGHANLAVPQDCGLAQTLLPALLRGVERLVPTTADLVDDLVHAGEELGERADGPLLQGLGQDGVVGVAHDLRHDVPGVVPLELLLVDEDAHELGAAHGGVRVVGVDGHKLRQQLPVLAVLLLKGVEQTVDAGRDKQVLLLQAQQTTVLAGVVGIEDGADGLGFGALGIGQGIVAAVEGLQIEVLLDWLCSPDAQFVDGLAGIAHDGDVVGDSQDVLRVHRAVERAAVLLIALNVATKLNGHGLVLTTDLPGIAVGEPLVGGLDLAAVDDLLLKQAVAVAHAVAIAGNALGCHGIQEARCQTAQATVAQRRIGLLVLDDGQVKAHVVERLGDHVAHAKVEQIVVEQAADQKLDREVVHALLALGGDAGVTLGGNGACLLGHELGQGVKAVEVAGGLDALATDAHDGIAIELGKLLLVVEDLIHTFLSPGDVSPGTVLTCILRPRGAGDYSCNGFVTHPCQML